MSLHRSAGQASARRDKTKDPVVRLDLAQNPHGPCLAAIEAIETCRESPPDPHATMCLRAIAESYHLPTELVHLDESADAVIRGVVERHDGQLVAFPPSATMTLMGRCTSLGDPLTIARGPARDAIIGPDLAADLPADALAIIDSPSNPLGLLLSPADLVRLARACACVVVDERFAEYSGFSLLPIARELENVVIVRSFESWAGLPEVPCAWAAASPRLAGDLRLASNPVPSEAIAAAMATLENRASVAGTLQLVREERSRLYRFLRKLSFLEPLPSWAPFIAARVTIASRQNLIDGLAKRGVRVHAPSEAGLEQYVRIGIGSRTAMDRLQVALLELGPELVD